MKKVFIIAVFLSYTLTSFADMENKFFETSDGVRLRYIEDGKGETLIFITGWKMPAEIWKHQISFFSKNYHVIAIDPRSQGLSEISLQNNTLERRSKDILELIAFLKVEPLSLIGWSAGMWEIINLLSFEDTMDIKSIVLVDNAMERDISIDFIERAMHIWGAHQKDPISTTGKFVRSCFNNEQSEQFISEIIELSLNTPASIAFAIGANQVLVERNWWPILDARKIKTLYVVRGKYSNEATVFKEHYPDARVEVFEDAGHALFVDEFNRFNIILSEFVEGI